MENPGAHVLLDAPVKLSGARVSAALAERYPDVPVVVGGDEAGILLNFSGLMVMLRYFDVALPPLWPSEIERARRTRWPEAETAFDRHKAHIMISVVHGEEFSRVRLARAVSAAVGAAIDSEPACSAVLWDKTLIHSAAEAAELSRPAFEEDLYVGTLWIDLDPFEDKRTATSGVITVGLRNFIGREIEMEGRDEDWNLLQHTAGNLALYFLGDGVEVEDGETFSNPDYEDVKIPMHFRDSPRYEGVPVIAITLPPPRG
ncbi:MAG: DUF4261 domain-containing protein [Xanthobacteraceae bacterium]|nr:DUF4261 domain-containing protein [Xanthobacteraceae bacterium]